MLVQALLAVGGATVVAVLVVWAASRQRKTRAPRPFDLPTDAKRAIGREAEFRKLAKKFKDPLWDDDLDG